MIKVIIFDLGGVVIESAFKPFSAEIETLYDIPKEKVETIVRKHWNPLLRGEIKEGEYWKRFANDLNIKYEPKRFREIMLSFYVLKNEVVKLLKRLKKRYKIALLSNVSREWMEYTKQKYPMNELFDIILTSYKLRLAKPHSSKYKNDAEIYRVSLEKINIEPNECIFIDNNEQNLRPAKKLGIKTILFKNAKQLESALKKLRINL